MVVIGHRSSQRTFGANNKKWSKHCDKSLHRFFMEFLTALSTSHFHKSSKSTFRKMTNSEKFCLQWNDYRESIISPFDRSRMTKISLMWPLPLQGGHHIEAHKVVLASSSHFFMALLQKSKHPHPLIYMRGLNSNDLTSMPNFLCVGEANVFQEDPTLSLHLLKSSCWRVSLTLDNKRTEDLKIFKEILTITEKCQDGKKGLCKQNQR